MSFRSTLRKMKNYFIPHTEIINAAGYVKKTWLGHERHYDQRGCILSHRYQTPTKKVLITYYPGTDKNYADNFVLRKRVEEKKTRNAVERWFTFNQHLYATVKGKVDEGLLEDSYISIHFTHELAPFRYHVLNNLKRAFFRAIADNSLSRFDLKKTAKALSEEMKQLHSDEAVQHKYESTRSTTKDSSHSLAKEEAKPQVQQPSPNPSEEPVEQVKQKPTDDERRDRWETQLLQRMEKHDLLVARRKKILSSKMKPENKEKRLASIDRQILQNEKAQYILNRKLSVLDAAQNLSGWKQTIKEERANCAELRKDIKGLTQTIQELNQHHKPKNILSLQRSDLSELRQMKADAVVDYRVAQKATKVAAIQLKKLRNVKRQDVIFELSYIMKEKSAIEQAMKTETDIIEYARMRDRLKELRLQRRLLIRSYKPATKKTSTKGIFQPTLPHFQEAKAV